MPEAKRVSASRTQQIQIVLSAHVNGAGRLFGGQLMQWIDVVAAVVARRHSGRNVTTAAIDNLQFRAPALLDSTIVLDGCVTWVGHTSMEVRVDTFVEQLGGERTLVNRAYFVLVALGESGKPAEVPGLLPETEEELLEQAAGARRNEARRARRGE